MRGLDMRTPATWILIGANIVMFIIEESQGGSTKKEVAMRFGAMYAPKLQGRELYRLITSMFLHFGVFHLFCNMWSLYNLGPIVELLFGPFYFLAIYFISGLCGNLLTWAVEKKTGKYAISAGASGAVFGLLGAMLVLALLPSLRGYFSLRSILLTLVINVAYGVSNRSINMKAHAGGFIGGVISTVLIVTIITGGL